MFPRLQFPLVSSVVVRRPSRQMSTRPSFWKSAAPSPPKTATTFAAQHSLPRLPVAPLAPSLVKLKESLRPLAWSDTEYAAAEKKIDQFANSPQAAELHARLVKRAAETSHWLEQWWDDLAYLGYRDSVRTRCFDHHFFSLSF
jgi:carnitine O-acetyltransferase